MRKAAMRSSSSTIRSFDDRGVVLAEVPIESLTGPS